jgi:hypothetical protein
MTRANKQSRRDKMIAQEKADFSHHLAGSNPNHEETGMAEANQSISQIPTIRITTAAHALAKLRSRQAVKRRSRQEG